MTDEKKDTKKDKKLRLELEVVERLKVKSNVKGGRLPQSKTVCRD